VTPQPPGPTLEEASMRARRWTAVVIVVAALVVAAGLVLLGRVTAAGAARAEGYRAGLAAGDARGRQEGRAAGRADGLREGRALQQATSLPPGARDAARAAFEAGYAAGADDVFGGYDGGWSLSSPYVVTLARGGGATTYRIDSRVPLQQGVAYYLCPRSHALCQEPRR
jgi:hypothetical protein